ncbi:MAG TPA: hypothetical protein VE242_01980 [Chthoniobacterales bacterium]|nr:hypothetical protein [Chthoniobacterales bacterium]
MSKTTQNILALISVCLLSGSEDSQAQWRPPASLQDVPVLEDCEKTKGGIGISFQPTLFDPHGAIFLCPTRALEIDRAHPGASLFFRVHEYGHLALHTRNETLADAWAAEELSRSTTGRKTLEAVLFYFIHLGKRFALLYGTGYDRALTVAESGRVPHEQWPSALVEYQRGLNEKRARNGTVQLQMSQQMADGLLWIDDQLVGFVSIERGYRNPPVPDLSGRNHTLRLQDVWVSDSPGHLVTHGIDASAAFEGGNSTNGLVISLNYQGDSLTVSVSH